jgi:hypothetical protein
MHIQAPALGSRDRRWETHSFNWRSRDTSLYILHIGTGYDFVESYHRLSLEVLSKRDMVAGSSGPDVKRDAPGPGVTSGVTNILSI